MKPSRPRLRTVDRPVPDGAANRQALALQPRAEAPGDARRALRAWLAQDALDGWRDVVVLVGSELVTNAVVHAGTDLELTYAFDGANLEIAVRDQDRQPILVSGPEAATLAKARSTWGLAAGGRGLTIVDALADEWGVTALQEGKRVWARWFKPRLDS